MGGEAQLIDQASGKEREDRPQYAPIAADEDRRRRNLVQQHAAGETKRQKYLAPAAREQQDDRGEQQRDIEFDRSTPCRSVPAQAGMQMERLQEQNIGDGFKCRVPLSERLRVQRQRAVGARENDLAD